MELEDERYPATPQLSSIGQYCYDLYNEYRASEYRERVLKEAKEGRERYENDMPPKTFPWAGCSNISVGLTAIAVDNLEPRVKSQIISSDDFLVVEPVGDEDVETAEAAQEFLHWALRNNVRIDEAIHPIIHNLLLDGTVDIIPVWRETVEEFRTRSMQPIYATPDGQPVQLPPGVALDPRQAMAMGLQIAGMQDSYEVRERNIWRVEYIIVPLQDGYCPDNADDWSEQPYLRMIYPKLEELEMMSDEYGGPYFGIDKDLVIEGARNLDDQDTSERIDEDISYSEYTTEVRVLECYVRWKGEWRIASFAVDKGFKEIRNQPLKDVYWHGRKPVRRIKIYPETHRSYGKSIPTKVKDFANAINDLWNQLVDSGTVEVLPWFLVEEGPGMSTVDMTIYPGRAVPIPKGSNVTVPNLGVKSPVFLQFINTLMGFFERTISLSDFAMGREGSIGGKGAETFSGMNLIVSEGNIKHGYMAEGLRPQFSALFRDTLVLYGQYLPIDAKMRIKRDNQWQFVPVDPVALQRAYDIQISVSDASANKMLHRKEVVEMHQLLAGNPTVSPAKDAEQILKAYEISDPAEWMIPEAMQVLQAVQANPEIIQIIQRYLQDKSTRQREQMIAQQAQDNLRRQEIERQVEDSAGVEQRKLVDQVGESIKREAIKPVIRQAAGMAAQGAI